MAKILYAVAKEGMGHAIRSKTIIEELLKKHKIKIVSSGRPFHYLRRYFRDTHKISDFDLVYTNNSVNYLLTFLSNLIRLPFMLIYNLKLVMLVSNFKPDIIITDFEPFSNYIAYLFRIPLISIDNQHIITKCKIDVPKKFMKDYLISYFIVNLIVNNAKKYFITSFFFPGVKEKNVSLFPPVIGRSILKAKPRKGEHVLVYQTSKSYKRLFKVLKKVNGKFIIYGFDKESVDKNLVFRKFNNGLFYKDLAESKAVIANCGFTLISEAIYLKKPILSIPIRHQFEQIFNAIYLGKLGYGEFHEFLTEDNLKTFLSNLKTYENNLKKFKKYDNSEIFKRIEESVEIKGGN